MAARTNDEKLDAIIDMLHEIQEENAARDAVREQIQKDVSKHTEILEGNGKLGLKSEVALLKDQVARLISVGAAVIGLFGVQVIAIIFGFLTHTLKFVP